MTTIPTAQLIGQAKSKDIDFSQPLTATIAPIQTVDTDQLEAHGWIIVDDETNQIIVFDEADKFGDNPIAIYQTTADQVALYQTTDTTELIITGSVPVSEFNYY